MNFLSKKVPISLVIASIFITAAVTFPISYNLALNKINKIVAFNREKQEMYQKLSDIDGEIRRESVLEIDEEYLKYEICKGYAKGTKSSFCNYFSKEEYKKFLDEEKNLLGPIYSENLTETIGYLQIKHLGKDSGESFVRVFNEFTQKGINKIVLDLRNVNTGEIDNVSKILSFLMPKGDIITSINKKGEKEVVCKSVSEKVNAQFAILVNEKTKGVSELIPSAFKDEGTAKIVGKITSGEAMEKKVMDFFDGTVLIYPCAHYVTKNGEIFYKKGITPGILCELSLEKQGLFEKDELGYSEDDQLQEAVKLF